MLPLGQEHGRCGCGPQPGAAERVVKVMRQPGEGWSAKPMSAKERLERKKYMGLWRWESEVTAKMMSRFPSMVTSTWPGTGPRAKAAVLDHPRGPRGRILRDWLDSVVDFVVVCILDTFKKETSFGRKKTSK